MYKSSVEKNISSDKGTTDLKEDIFRRIVESAPNAIVLINSEGKISLVNAQTEKMFGYKRDELFGKSVELLIPHRFRGKHSDFRNAYFGDPSTRPMGAGRDLFGLCKDGSEIPVEIGLTPINSNEGVFILGSIIDITERKRAEQKFRRVVESVPNAIVLVNQEGRMTLVNAQMEILFGYSREELIGHPVEMLIPNHLSNKHALFRDTYFINPTTRPMSAVSDLFGLRKDGTEIPLEIGLNPIESEEGILVLGSIIDITERKLAEAKKKEETELAEQHERELIRLAELERFQKLTIGRELKMIELKKEIEELKAKLDSQNLT